MSWVCRCLDGFIRTRSPQASARRKARRKCSSTCHLTHLIRGAASNVPRDRVLLRRRLERTGRGAWDAGRDAVRLHTCQFLLPFHPSDGRGRLAADGCAGELRLVALADHVVAALDDWATWGDWPTAETPIKRHFTSTFLYWSTNHWFTAAVDVEFPSNSQS